MPEKYYYTVIDFCCLLVPFLASFHSKIKFYKHWAAYFPATLFTAIIFIFWDICFTQADIWSFNPRYLLGFYLWNLPIEEVAFFICIPYSCLFTYYCCKIFLKRQFNYFIWNIFIITLAGILFIVGCLHLHQLYTSVTFILLSVLLIGIYLKQLQYMPYFFMSFSFILLPFFISNGFLTGSWIAEPIVRYNNSFNLHIRIFTIPIEDIFYSMLLQLMNVVGFEFLINKK